MEYQLKKLAQEIFLAIQYGKFDFIKSEPGITNWTAVYIEIEGVPFKIGISDSGSVCVMDLEKISSFLTEEETRIIHRELHGEILTA